MIPKGEAHRRIAAAKKRLGLPGLLGGLDGRLRGLVRPRGLLLFLRLKVDMILRGEVVGESGGVIGDVGMAVAASLSLRGLLGVGFCWAPGERARTSS